MKQRYDHFIHGAWTPPANGQYVERISPATEEPLTTIARGSARDIDIAVQDAHRAYPAWRALAPGRRAELMRAVANGIRAEAEALALLQAQETGKALARSRNDVAVTARYFDYYAELGHQLAGETIIADPSTHTYTVREPFGVCGNIVPWNPPMHQADRKSRG